MADRLDDAHLAELHALGAELEVPRYRMLRRDELVREIRSRRGEEGEPEGTEEEAEESEASAELAGEREPAADSAAEPAEDDEAEGPVLEGVVLLPDEEEPVEVDAAGAREPDEPVEEVTGVLEILPQRYGFLRVSGLRPDESDVYISASQVRRCELRSGDEVTGPAREPRRGERHRALVHVDAVNGEEPLAAARPDFESFPPVDPERRVPLDSDPADVLARAVDLLTPLALGQRALVRSAPRSGRTTLLRGLGRAIERAGGIRQIVLLVDERPEEATAWREALEDAEFAIATAELARRDQIEVAELALERGRRLAEAGTDVVLLVDSLSRLAQAAGGVDEVKRIFGSGRNMAGAGSLTVIATVLDGAVDEGEAERAVITTESALITLDPELAAAGVVPALKAAECRVSNEEGLREPEELEAARRLRALLADLDPREAAGLLRARIEGSPSNAELLSSL